MKIKKEREMICDGCQKLTEVMVFDRGQYCEKCRAILCFPGNHKPMSVCVACPQKDNCPAEVK